MAQLYLLLDTSTDPPSLHLWERKDSQSTPVEKELPPELRTVPASVRPQMLSYRRRVHSIGILDRPIVRDEFGKFRASGVLPPRTIPTLADGSYSGGSEGLMIGYQTFLVKVGGQRLAESNPGPATLTLDAAGTGRLWGNLDWTPSDSHVTHSRGYVGVDGEVPSLAWERPIAAGGDVGENVLTTGLGEPLPVRVSSSGTIVLNRYARGIPPYTKFAEEYHNAFFYAGDPNHPERIYPSKLYEPEAVNTTPITVFGRTEYPWLVTTEGDAVTGIKRQADELLVGTIRGMDVIQGYSHGDYTIRRISNYWGVTSHHSMRRCGPLGSLFFSAPQGPTLYNAGSFKFIGGPLETWWRDNFKLFPEIFSEAYGAEDRFWRAYKLLLPQYQGYSLYLVCDYMSAEAGDPMWVKDIRARNDQVMGELFVDNSTSYYDLYVGSCDGIVRRENVDSDPDDDGDTYQKRMVLTEPHRYVAGQEGDDAHGRTFNGLDLFMKHTNNAVIISMWAGDDDAPSAASRQWGVTSPATAAAAGERPVVERTSERHVPTDLSGKGVTLRVEVVAPVGIEYRGWAVDHIPGPQSRPFK